jgi:HlyD family secretion protein
MDRELPKEVVNQRKRKVYIRLAIGLASLIIILFVVNQFVSATIDRNKTLTAKVVRGEMTSTLSSTGEVLPEIEEIVTSPLTAKVQLIIRSAGQTVKVGDSILLLDKENIQLICQKQSDELELEKAGLAKMEITVNKNLQELQSDIAIKQLRIKGLEAAFANQKRLFAIGGGTQEEADKAGLELKIANLELQRMSDNLANLKASRQLELREQKLKTDILTRELAQNQRKLAAAGLQSRKNGVLTWVFDKTGVEVREGQELAKIADLTSFKIKASITESYGQLLRQGQNVLIKIGELCLSGIVSRIVPAVSNNMVEFYVSLKEKNHPALRPNLKLEVFPVTGYKKDALMVKNSGFFNGKKEQYVFVLHGNKAERKVVTTGLFNQDFVEITSGLSEGDEIIIIDMKDYENRKQLTIE